MISTGGFLSIQNGSIADAAGRPVRLRGFCIGGWLNMENFINGYAGNESAFRRAVARALGKEKARFFFDRHLDYYMAEADVEFLASLGVNCVRLPLNYRHFEDDDKPFEYKFSGLKRLDRFIAWCKKHGVYVILDLHAAQGWQNPDWHSDNPGMHALLWEFKHFQDRATALWEEFARRYKNEAAVAGYNLINEPVANDVAQLNAFYNRVIKAIRKVDRKHIIFLEGNLFSTDFSGMSAVKDKQTTYSSHNYVKPGFYEGEYPGIIDGEHFDRDRLERDYLKVTGYMRDRKLPVWVGEFGSVYNGSEEDRFRFQALKDMIGLFEKYQDHWSMWTYKDIGMMGLAYVDPDSEWMRRTAPIREVKVRYKCDTWQIKPKTPDPTSQFVADKAREAGADPFIPSMPWYQQRGRRAVRSILFSEQLVQPFADQFKGMTETQIDAMMASFKLEKCRVRETLKTLLAETLS